MAGIFIYQLDIEGPDSPIIDGQPLNHCTLPAGKSSIGRVAGNKIVLGHPLVSRGHAQLEVTSDGCFLTDLGSANGTTLNGQRLSPNVPERLPDSATITIGPFDIRFTATLVVDTPEPEIIHQPDAVEESGSKQVQEPYLQPPQEALETEKASLSSAPEALSQAEPSSQGVDISRIMPPVAELSGSKGTGSPPNPPQRPHSHTGEPEFFNLPPGLDLTSQKLINYMPGIYHTEFMSHFLALFESIQVPIEWNIDNFDLYLDPSTAPASFLPWLANWFQVGFDSTWSETQRRTLLKEASQLYSRRGTRWALTRLLEIYTGRTPEIIEFEKNLAPYTFIVRLPLRARDVNRELVMQLIDANKPAYTTYSLEFLK